MPPAIDDFVNLQTEHKGSQQSSSINHRRQSLDLMKYSKKLEFAQMFIDTEASFV